MKVNKALKRSLLAQGSFIGVRYIKCYSNNQTFEQALQHSPQKNVDSAHKTPKLSLG
ncbi:hypothetical protein GCM10010919_16920 [Alishewanella longhuensis]|uniref:Uncharacterized protein n=1 Tax=Alishewanella longhuensis TaxID=1091037 RepID=A0ABQ3L693_9ALTE|nr:hypothetical protein GCM10010919_16920 [Alishewanella longhuensis]